MLKQKKLYQRPSNEQITIPEKITFSKRIQNPETWKRLLDEGRYQRMKERMKKKINEENEEVD